MRTHCRRLTGLGSPCIARLFSLRRRATACQFAPHGSGHVLFQRRAELVERFGACGAVIDSLARFINALLEIMDFLPCFKKRRLFLIVRLVHLELRKTVGNLLRCDNVTWRCRAM